MKICISAESTVDLTKELLERFEIKTLPFGVMLKDDLFMDGEISCNEIIDFVNKNKVLPKTSAINSYQYEEHFKKLKEEYDAIIHISLSSELSCACRNAQEVAKTMENVYVIDSRTLSTGIALLCISAKNMVDRGLGVEEIVEKISSRVKDVQASFILERLDYLFKGGRCNSLQLLGANLLKLRPQILVTNGKMVSGKKFRGKIDECIKKYCEDVIDTFNNPDKEVAFVTYTTATPEMIENAKEILRNAGFKNIYETTAGGTITSHCGEHCLGILYVNDGGKY